jgi:hypothetical protein
MSKKDVPGVTNGEGDRVAARAKGRTKVNPHTEGIQGLDARSQEAIGKTLKAHYEDLVSAPVPDKFLEMLDRLESAERTKPKAGSDGAG